MLTRRSFLRALGIGAAAAAMPAVLMPDEPATVVPKRRIWQVGAQLQRPSAMRQAYAGPIGPVADDHFADQLAAASKFYTEELSLNGHGMTYDADWAVRAAIFG